MRHYCYLPSSRDDFHVLPSFLRCIRRDIYGKFVRRLLGLKKLDFQRWEANLFVVRMAPSTPLELHPTRCVEYLQVPPNLRACEHPGCGKRGKAKGSEVTHIKKGDNALVPTLCEAHR